MAKKYIHVNQHKIRSNLKHGTNEPVITIKEGRNNTSGTSATGQFVSEITVID